MQYFAFRLYLRVWQIVWAFYFLIALKNQIVMTEAVV